MTQSAGSETRMTCPKCGLVAGAGVTLCPKDGTTLADYSKDPFVGRIIEQKYEIISPIGEGGMSVVYKAKHLLMDRFVAIKMIRPEYATMSQLIERFKQETKAVSSLRHPNIVTVFDYGFLPDQTPFLIMDYLEGTVLNKLIKKEKTMNWERVIVLFSQACDALAHSHERGVVHRDLKPSNLLVRQELEGTESLTIFDFGIAKLLNPDGKKLTNVGEVFGSPLYMSPEQCSGDMIDPRTDVYSLACVIYEALVGVPPLVGAKPIETIMKHINDTPRPLREVRPELNIPPRLEDSVMTALSKAPIDRQPNMITFRNELLSVGNLKLVATGVSVMLDPEEVLRHNNAAASSNPAPAPNAPYLQNPSTSNSGMSPAVPANPNASVTRVPGMQSDLQQQSPLQPHLQMPVETTPPHITDPPHIKENPTIQPAELEQNPFQPIPLPQEIVSSSELPIVDPNQKKDLSDQKVSRKTVVVQKKSPPAFLVPLIVALIVLGGVGGYLVAHPEVLQGSKTEQNETTETNNSDNGQTAGIIDEGAQARFLEKARLQDFESLSLALKEFPDAKVEAHGGVPLQTDIPFKSKIEPNNFHAIFQEIVPAPKSVQVGLASIPLTQKLYKNSDKISRIKQISPGFSAEDVSLSMVRVDLTGGEPEQYMLYIWDDNMTLVCQIAKDKATRFEKIQNVMKEVLPIVVEDMKEKERKREAAEAKKAEQAAKGAEQQK